MENKNVSLIINGGLFALLSPLYVALLSDVINSISPNISGIHAILLSIIIYVVSLGAVVSLLRIMGFTKTD